MVPLLPKFLKEEETLVGASRGTAYHRAMELLDFTAPAEISAIEEALERYRMDGRMTKEMADCVRAEELLTFLSSSCGERMKQAANAGLLYREQPLSLALMHGRFTRKNRKESFFWSRVSSMHISRKRVNWWCWTIRRIRYFRPGNWRKNITLSWTIMQERWNR